MGLNPSILSIGEKKITSLMVVGERSKLEGIVHLHDLWSTDLV